MRKFDRFKLRYGPYNPPKARRGSRLFCEIRGTVIVGRFSDGRISWPCVKRRGTATLILCGDLVTAVKRESSQAVIHHFGVSRGTVSGWRRALGVPRKNEGSHQLWREISILRPDDRLARARRNSKTPKALAKASAKLKGRTIPPHVIEAVREAVKRPRSPAWKKKMAAYWRKRGHPPCHPERRFWTAKEQAMLGTAPDGEIARRLNRSLGAVYSMRYVMKTTRLNPTTPASADS